MLRHETIDEYEYEIEKFKHAMSDFYRLIKNAGYQDDITKESKILYHKTLDLIAELYTLTEKCTNLKSLDNFHTLHQGIKSC